MADLKAKAHWRILFASLLIAGGLAIKDIVDLAAKKGFSLAQPKWIALLVGVGAIMLFVSILLAMTWTGKFEKIKTSYDAFLTLGRKAAIVFFLLFVFSLFLLPFIALHPYLSSLLGKYLWVKIFVFLVNAFLGASFLRAGTEKLTWAESLALAALAQLLLYRLIIDLLYFSNYPFSLGWTRDSRYYDASRFFSERFYDQTLVRPLINPSLYMILSVPFFFGKLPIWVHRGWSLLLTFGLSWAVAVKAVPHLKEMLQERKINILLPIWIFLYLLTGSVYAHLLIPTFIIFAFVKISEPKRSWVAIIIASIWAGISRINWFPVPALLAALIYVLEVKLEKDENIFRYFSLPFAWGVVGTLTAFLSKAVYGELSGNAELGSIYPSLTSYLIWERLLPNATYAPGILFGSLLLSAALFGMILVTRPKGWHPLRGWAIFLAILVLFVGGSVVSVKIGGGAELHNMDAYLISLLLVGMTLFAREVWLDPVKRDQFAEKIIPVFATGIFVLAWFILRGTGSWGYDKSRAEITLNELQAESTRVASEGEEVLFVAQRHLLAVGLIEDVPLVPEHENNYLMEMVMSQNAVYLDGFHDDLRHQKYGLIVLNPQSNVFVSDDRSFAAENNLWVRKVTRPLLCYYELYETYDVGIELYTPLTETSACD